MFSFLSNILTKKAQIEEPYRTFIERLRNEPFVWGSKLKDHEIGREILDLSMQEKAQMALAMAIYLKGKKYGATSWEFSSVTLPNGNIKDASILINPSPYKVEQALLDLLRQNIEFSKEQLLEILSWSIQNSDNYCRGIPQIIKTVENFLKQNSLTTDLQSALVLLAKTINNDDYKAKQYLKGAAKLEELASIKQPLICLIAGDAWSDAAIARIESLDAEKKAAWIKFLSECQKASGSQPSTKWLKTANAILEKIGFENFKQAVVEWFPLVDKPRTKPLKPRYDWSPDPNQLLDDTNADILKGLVWLCGEREDREIASRLSALAISTYRKVPKAGPRCVRVGNACVYALGAMPGAEGVSQLALLKLKVKFGSAQKAIEKALNAAARRIGLSPEEIEEMSVPSYGLTEIGKRIEQFGDFTAELVVSGTNATEIRWFNSDRKQQKSVPKSVKENYAEELKELNATAKEIKKTLPAQRNRIENLYLEEKRWEFPVWRERYLLHPLIGTISERLVWRFTKNEKTEAAIWFDGKFLNANECEINWLDDETKVELWHPLHSEMEEVLAWRAVLQEREIRQPFKQAHREIYLLTDAERNTGVYSNRFAAHIIKQHQFNALCEQRGWKNALWIMADMEVAPPARRIPKHNLRAEFLTEPIGENYETDATESGAYRYLATDQVRFYPLDAGVYWSRYQTNLEQHFAPVPLEQIPPLVFSEIMRDVDLFVGVASVGNDPNWSDGGADNRYRDYWNSYSFGDLSESAKTRREVLAKLIPRLKIAAQCELSDKFLFVRGAIRTYKIHLGSGNILMSPNDQYLCIVPSSSGEFGDGKVFLPFEGDRTLAVILSKAFLLAEDQKITDSKIVRQLKL
jgi:hypothetical protein